MVIYNPQHLPKSVITLIILSITIKHDAQKANRVTFLVTHTLHNESLWPKSHHATLMGRALSVICFSNFTLSRSQVFRPNPALEYVKKLLLDFPEVFVRKTFCKCAASGIYTYLTQFFSFISSVRDKSLGHHDRQRGYSPH